MATPVVSKHEHKPSNKKVFDGKLSIIMPPPTANVSVTLTFYPMTLKKVLTILTEMVTNCDKFQ